MNSLDLDGLRSFLAVVESNSFSKAAERVGRTQSAVSLQLAKLERMLGAVLIRRRQGRVEGLTERGRDLLPFARRMVALNEAAWRALVKPAVSGRVRLGVPADFMDAEFPRVLRRFYEACPGVELAVASDVSETLRRQVRQGILDVAFFKRLEGEGEGTVVARQELVWVGSPAGPRPSPEDGPLPLVLFPAGCAFRARVLAVLERAGVPATIAYTSPSLDSVRSAVAAGLGVGALPRAAASGLARLDDGLPPLGAVELAVMLAEQAGPAAEFLAEELARRLTDPSGPGPV